jgi:hypothetical protein
MNLHIVPDNVFINKFYDNLLELGLLENNRILVRTNHPKLGFIKRHVPFARLYSSEFASQAGDLMAYDKVYIHQFTPLLYRWVADHNFNELNWMVWGADLYNLPSVKTALYEKITLNKFVKKDFSLSNFAYQVKVLLLHSGYQEKAYAKVNNVLTWMESEYDFALNNVPSLKAGHQFFFYENQIPYHDLNQAMTKGSFRDGGKTPVYILGNSSTPELNHVDAVKWMDDQEINATLHVPVSYGNARYTRFLKKNLSSFYRRGEIVFVERYMDFDEYIQFLYNGDGLIMNNIRPQGYGNILMMMYLGKSVFLNERNLSISELDKNNLMWSPLKKMRQGGSDFPANRAAVLSLLSHEKLLQSYQKLFI